MCIRDSTGPGPTTAGVQRGFTDVVRHVRGPGPRGPASGLPPLEVQSTRLSTAEVPTDWPRAGLGGKAAGAHV
eukprot:8280186-Alexandrium_andersonii.AAC.1